MLTNLTRRVYAAWHNAGVPFSPATMEKLMTKPTHAETHYSVWEDTGQHYSEAAIDSEDYADSGYDTITRYEFRDGSSLVASGDFVDYGIHRDHLNDVDVQAAVEAAIEASDQIQPRGTPVEFAGVSALNLEELAYPAQD